MTAPGRQQDRAGQQLACAPSARYRRHDDSPAQPSVLRKPLAAVLLPTAGLAGYVEYPTQELTSGLYPIGEMGNLTSLATTCIKPGQALFETTTAVRDTMVSHNAVEVAGRSNKTLPALYATAALRRLQDIVCRISGAEARAGHPLGAANLSRSP